MHGRVAAKKPFISKKNAEARLNFAKKYSDWTVEDWKRVLWTDESKFNKVCSDGKRYVRRPKNKRYDPKYTKGTVKFGGGNIMVWGCFSWFGLGPLYLVKGNMDAVQYRDDILSSTMLPFAANLPANWLFQQDNDPKHKSKLVSKWLSDNNIKQLSYSLRGKEVIGTPAQSADLNPIENLWNEAKKPLRGRRFKKDQELFSAALDAWQSVPKERLEKLVESMPRRMKAVINAKGYATKY